MYGGKIDVTGNVSSQLWVFHISNQSWALVTPKAKEQYAVVGHSAHIVTLQDNSTVMLILFGHCPLYGYISNVQEYNLGECGWGPPASHFKCKSWFGSYLNYSCSDSKTQTNVFSSSCLYLQEVEPNIFV